MVILFDGSVLQDLRSWFLLLLALLPYSLRLNLLSIWYLKIRYYLKLLFVSNNRKELYVLNTYIFSEIKIFCILQIEQARTVLTRLYGPKYKVPEEVEIIRLNLQRRAEVSGIIYFEDIVNTEAKYKTYKIIHVYVINVNICLSRKNTE